MKIDDVLAQERRARMAAERLLAQKQAELSDANRKLSLHARNLSEEIVETREDLKETLTENSLVKADLERAAEEVVIAKRRLWDSLETIEDGFAVFDQNECMIAANSAYLKPFDGLECITPGISYVEILHAVLDEGIVDIGTMRPLAWRDMMLTRWRAPKLEPHTVRLWDGTYIKLVDRRSGDGDTVSLGLNITDTIQYEAKLKEARFTAEAANRSKSAFLANMSHEIRTPMNGVIAIAELLAEGELDEEQQLYVQTIKNSGEALLTIINDVLDYSKIEAAKLVLKTEPFDLEAKLHDVVTLLMPSMQEKGLEISVDFDLFVPTLLTGDPVRIGQILTNLIGNAVKFTPEGHVQVRVLGVPVDGGTKQKIHITVEDSGIGIPAEMQSHIFGEFNQVEDERNRRFDGTGLGLAITKQLVELMHGEIWVESEDGNGSCFGLHMTLPVVQNVEIPNLPLGLTTATLLMDAGLHQTTLYKSLQAMGLEVHRITSPDALPSELNGHHVLFVQEELLARATPTMLHSLSSANVRVIQVKGQNHQAAAPTPTTCRIDRTLSMPILRQELFQTLQEIDFKSVPAEPAAISNAQDTLEAVAELITAPQANPASPPPAAETEHTIGHGDDQPAQNVSPRPPEQVDLQHQPVAPLPRLQPQPEQTSSPVQNDQTASQAPSQSCPLPPTAPAQDLRQMRVLAAEDNRTNRLVFSKLVKPLDIDLKFANNGREALELFKSFQPDLVFMDISMPEMDGKQATRCIRELEAEQGLPHTRVVALTAHAMAGDAEEILRHGLDKHLTKPLKKPLIIDEIRDNCPINARPPLLED